MKNKLLLFFTVTLLFSGMSFAHNNGGDKRKDKTKKPTPTSCPGKTCGKKKTN